MILANESLFALDMRVSLAAGMIPCILGVCWRPHNLSCWEVTTRATKVGYLMYLGNSNGVLPLLILSCCEDESVLVAYK
jgi:hypothetical protein